MASLSVTTDIVQIKHALVAIHGAEACSYLNVLRDRIGPLKETSHQDGDFLDGSLTVDLDISRTEQGLVLVWNKVGEKPLKFHLDFIKVANQLRSFPAPKQGAFNQALGKKTKSVIDATGGWGGDALLMFLQGYEVTIIERLPIMASLLSDAFDRLSKSLLNSPKVGENTLHAPKVLCGNALSVLRDNRLPADCVYLDPMFPPKRKKSAATNKQMQLLQWLAGPDSDASELATYAHAHYPRVTVKRPDYAHPLLTKPSVQFSSKLVHYDVYL